MFLSYLVIKRQLSCYSMPFDLIFNMCPLHSLSLHPSWASKISTHVLTQIYFQTCLKVLMKSITNFLDICWSLICMKFSFSMFLNNFDNFPKCYNPQSTTLLAHLSSFLFLFPFLISFIITLSMVLSFIIFKYLTKVTTCD